MNVAIVGHLCVDLAPNLRERVELEPGALFDVGALAISLGGCVANTSRALSALGHPATAYAVVGADELGAIVRSQLTASGIDARVREVAAATSYSLVLEPRGIDRTFWHHVGANAHVNGAEVRVEGLDLLHLGYPSLLPALLADDAAPLEALLQRARDAGATTSVDLAVVDPTSQAAEMDWPTLLRRIAARADILTPSLDDLASVLRMDSGDDADLAELFADLLISWGAAVVVISAGLNGLVLRTADSRRLAAGGSALRRLPNEWADRALRMPAIAIDNVSTTNGAGDASTAGILSGILRALSPEETLQLATASSAAVVSGGSPTISAVVEFAADLRQVLTSPAVPILIGANQPPARFYRGGAQIADFRAQPHIDPFTPEDWVGSTVCVRGDAKAGLTRLPDGRVLRDAIAEDPEYWLGPDHVRRFGSDPMLLVKLLDAGQRLPVHAHPDGEFAAQHLGAAHGKVEAWHILAAGSVYLGLTRDVAPQELADLVEQQDVEALLNLLHEVHVEPGDRVLVPAGMLHAVGEGVMLVEVQEPEDLSILLEWRDFAIDGAADGHLGLGFTQALQAVDHRELHPARLERLVLRAGDGSSLPAGAEAYFRLESISVNGSRDIGTGFAVIIGVEGQLDFSESSATKMPPGATAIVPAAADSVKLVGNGRVLIARPPSP